MLQSIFLSTFCTYLLAFALVFIKLICLNVMVIKWVLKKTNLRNNTVLHVTVKNQLGNVIKTDSFDQKISIYVG